MPLLRTVTLGCKVNQYETEYVRQALVAAGYRDAAEHERADLCIVNTCTVTLEGDYKSRKIVRALARENPQAGIVVMGCYAARAPEEVAALPGVVEVIGDKRELPQLLARLGVMTAPRGLSSFGGHRRAYVKVQDGCRGGCTYCIIPRVRPVLVSRPVEEVLDEVRRLVDGGHLEIILTGIHLGHYGLDWNERGHLAYLVRRIVDLPGNFRVRLSSIEAAEMTDDLVDLLGDSAGRLCPHVHLPLQSGSESVLQRMGRPAGLRQIRRGCERLRARLDAPAVTTDVMVGFPGETEADFQATCRAVRELAFSKLHVFKFSPREGTPAAAMPKQVPYPTKHRRGLELAEIGRELRGEYCRSLVGRRVQLLAEERPEMAALVGTSERYVLVEVPPIDGTEHGFLSAVVTEVCDDHLRGWASRLS
jgi:threonylcarbamoyladenosine tRNA methylthiotransferase MtaB